MSTPVIPTLPEGAKDELIGGNEKLNNKKNRGTLAWWVIVVMSASIVWQWRKLNNYDEEAFKSQLKRDSICQRDKDKLQLQIDDRDKRIDELNKEIIKIYSSANEKNEKQLELWKMTFRENKINKIKITQ